MFEPPETMTIGEAAARAGVRASALRYYESVGLLPAAKRVSGQRRYAVDTLEQVAFIQAAQRAGFSLGEIKTLQEVSGTESSYSERIQQLARRKLPEVVDLIARAQERKTVLEAGLSCRCRSAEDCMLFRSASG